MKTVSRPRIKKDVKAAEIPPEKHFVLCSGERIKDIRELAHMIESISDEEFSFHVNAEKNDFSSWIRDVFEQGDLAEQIRNIGCRKEFQITLLKHLVSGRGAK